MQRNQKTVSARGVIVLLLAFINAIVLQQAMVSGPQWYKLSFITLPLWLVSIVIFRNGRAGYQQAK